MTATELTADELIDALGELRERAERSDVLKEKLEEAEATLATYQAEMTDAHVLIEELEDALEGRNRSLPAAVWIQVDRFHHDARHAGLVRFCAEPGCEGWDLVMKDQGLSWPPV